MKKRILCFFSMLALCLGLLLIPAAVAAASNPCFMAVEDTLLPLETRYIPITIGGQYYVPYTALDQSVTGLSLGIFPIYNSSSRTLLIYTREKLLEFNLAAGTCSDSSGTLQARAVSRDGQIYVPARFVADYFGLSYSSRTTTYGPMVRIKSASSRLDDTQFVGLAQMMMESRLQDWRKAQGLDEETAVSPAVSATPTPEPSPTFSPIPDEPDKSGVRLYLAFRADRTDGLESLLTRLDSSQVQALFFFPAQELAQYDEQVRRVLCAGHAVGLSVTGTTADEITQQAREGNRVLNRIAHLDTYTLLAPDASSEGELDAVRSAGWLCWRTDLNAVPDGRSASAQAASVLANADRFRYEAYILSDTSAAGAALMGRLLPELDRAGYDLRLAVETEI